MMRRLPLSHLAVEVPWQEEGWTEEGLHDFLCENDRSIYLDPPLPHRHPFSVLRRTELWLPPFTVATAPCWLERREAIPEETGVFARYALEWRPEAEPVGASQIMRVEHQQTICESFFSAIRPEESLVFIYAKRTPLSADGRPVIVAIGKVVAVGSPIEWDTSESEELTSLLPYRAVEHSIRTDMESGFAFPYTRLLSLFPEEPDLSAELLACAIPLELLSHFRGGASLLEHDAALALLSAASVTVRAIQKALPGNGTAPLPWIEQEKLRVRTLRGDAPGASAALRALGVRSASAIVADLADLPGPLWPKIENALTTREGLSPQTAELLPASFGKVWELLSEERRALLKLLAKIALTPEQAVRLYNIRGGPPDAEVLLNPWLLAELDAAHPGPLHFRTLDRGLFAGPSLNEQRLRALASAALQEALERGHTLLPADDLVAAMERLSPDLSFGVTSELLGILAYTVEGGRGVRQVPLQDGSPAFQLERMAHYGEVIRKALRQRSLRRLVETVLVEEEEEEEKEEILPEPPARPTLKLVKNEPEEEPEPAFTPGIGFRSANRPPTIKVLKTEPPAIEAPKPEPPKAAPPKRKPPAGPKEPPWMDRLQEVLSGVPTVAPELEERARAEKALVLSELYASRFTILVAPPQTGGSLVLRLWAEAVGKLTVIAPSVELSREARQISAEAEGLTVDHLPSRGDRWKNVVVLHATMLGEQELAKILFAARGAERVVLVGDPSLPMPAGAGRPFVDIAEELAPQQEFPRIARGYAELTIRFGKADRLRVADWFSGRPLPAGACEARDVPERFGVRFVSWSRVGEVSKRLIDAMSVSLELETEADFTATVSIGDTLMNRWQVLAPYRGGELGVDALNHRLQQHFRPKAREEAKPPERLAPVGPEGLLVGDKVVVVRPGRRLDVVPASASASLSAGEVGLLVGEKSWKLEGCFGRYPGTRFGFLTEEFTEEGGPVALAYALSVRWGQGLRHPIVYLVVPGKGALTREMIYAALTTSTERVVIFHPGHSDDLFRHEFPRVTDANRRYTNLFKAPRPSYLPEPGTAGAERELGEALLAKGLDIFYQPTIEAPDGSLRWPSFRFEDQTGRRVFWEHFGPARSAADLLSRQEVVEWYREMEIFQDTEAPWGGPNGLLVVTEGEEWRKKLDEVVGTD